MKRIATYSLLALVISVFTGCNPSPDIATDSLDSGNYSYALPDSLDKHLVSRYIQHPTETQLNTPVLIAAHGYTATTFEWQEMRELANARGTFYVSQVLLGGHGRSYESFKQSSWQDWQSSIKEEYRLLDSIGYKNIYLAGSSTGAPLIINMVQSGFFNNYRAPKGIFLIDPIIVSSNKTLTLVGALGPILGYTSVELSAGEQKHWYVYRPQETLNELMKLINLTRKQLEKTITLPTGTFLKEYKSKIDEVADPISAVMIYQGMRTSDGGFIETEIVNSKIHVFTRLKGRDGVTDADRKLQQRVFNEMIDKMSN